MTDAMDFWKRKKNRPNASVYRTPERQEGGREMSKRTKTGQCRAWVLCKCGRAFYYDYTPYGFGGFIVISPCGHEVREMRTITAKRGKQIQKKWKEHNEIKGGVKCG